MFAGNAHTELKQKVIAINSAERVNASTVTSDTNYFTTRIAMPYNNRLDKCSMLECLVPKSYYMLETALTFTLYEATGTQSTTPSIAGGQNYTAAELATAIAAALTTASATGSNSFTYTCTFSTTTNKFTFGHGGSGEFTLRMASAPLLAKYMGLYADDTSNVSASLSLVSPLMINLQRYDVLYIKSSLVNNNGDDVLARIFPGDVAYGDTLHYITADASLLSVGLSNNQTNQGTFGIYDKDGALVDLNGVNWQMTLGFYRDCNKLD